MTDALFKVGADTSDYVSKMAHAEKATKKVAKEAAGIGEQMGKAMLKVDLMVRALRAVGAAATDALGKATTAAEASANRGAGIAGSLHTLGIRNIGGVSKRMTAGGRFGSADDSASLAKSMAGGKAGSRRTPEEYERLLDKFGEVGAFGAGAGGEDFVAGLSEGKSVGDIIAAADAKFSAMSVAARGDPGGSLARGMELKLNENETQRKKEEAFAQSGAVESAKLHALQQRNAANPGGMEAVTSSILGDEATSALRSTASAAGDAPRVPGALGLLQGALGLAGSNAGEGEASRGRALDAMLLIERNTRRPPPSPNLSTGTGN